MRRIAITVGVAALLAACSKDVVDHRGDGLQRDLARGDGGTRAERARDAEPDGAAGTIRIYIRGDTSPTTFSDGLAGQTPKEYRMGLGRYDILRSASDPSPVIVFDHGAKPVDVDMLGTTLGGSARTADLAAGVYTHGRVLLTSCAFTVAATVHRGGLPVAGDIRVLTALSDGTLEGKPWKQGETTFTFKAGAAQQTVPGTLPALPSTGGGSVVQSGGRTWLLFPFPTPIAISPASPKSHKATIVYEVYESFRWEDESKAGYAPKVFDVDAGTLGFEPVRNFGATGYSVELD
jgi:hypothetical protein